MKRTWLTAVLFVCLWHTTADAQDRRISVTMLHLENRFGDLPHQWIEARNISGSPLRGFNVGCTFFAGSTPISEGGKVELGPIAPGQARTFTVGTSRAGAATRAECNVREAAWGG